MWLVLTRSSRPDRPYWRGRRVLAALDAVVWPLAWIGGVLQLPRHGGLVGVAIVVWASLAAVKRLRLAVKRNSRYGFTTWRWSKVAALVLFVAAVVSATLGT
jgi:hypothetical protein